jgi:hypothetical protein
MAFLNFDLIDTGETAQVNSFIRDVYSSHPDPSSYVAKLSVNNVISDAYPNLDRKEIERMAPHIIKAATGYELDYQGAWNAMRETFSQTKSQMKTSQDFFNVYAGAFGSGSFNSEGFALKKARFFEELANQKMPYRTDYTDMSALTDLAVASAGLLPYTLDSMKIYASGALVSALTENPAPLLLAKAANGVNVAMKEAGSIGLELARMQDDEGNKLNDELVWAVMTMVGIANGTIEVAFDAFPRGVSQLVKQGAARFVGKQSVKSLLKSESLKQWAMQAIRKYGSEMGQEMVTEALQELVSMMGQNMAASTANKDGGTFPKHQFSDFAKAMADVSVQTAKGMALMGLPSNVMTTLSDWKTGDAAMIRHADKHSVRSEDSMILPTDRFIVAESTKASLQKKPDGPIKVLDIGGRYRPVDAGETAYVRDLISKGVKALHVQVVNSEGSESGSSVDVARNIASALDVKHDGSQVVFDSPQQAKKAARDYALGSDKVVGYTENESGSVTISRQSEQGVDAVTFTDKSMVPEAKEVEVAKDGRVPASTKGSKKVKERVRQSFERYQNALDSMGVSESERDFLKSQVVEKVAKAYRAARPGASLDRVYDSATASAFFSILSARVAGMDAKTYFDKRFTTDAIIPMSVEYEKKHMGSSRFQLLVDLAMNNRGITDAAKRDDFRRNAVPAAIIDKDAHGKSTIHVNRAANEITIVHELGHALVDAIKDTEAFAPFKELYATELAADGGKVGTAFQERFASDLELYVKEGKIRDERLRSVFERITAAIKDFVKYVNRALDSDTRSAFDDLFDLGLNAELNPGHSAFDAATKGKISKVVATVKDPDAAAIELASIVEKERSLVEVSDLLAEYQLSHSLEGVEKRNRFRQSDPILPFQFWMMRLNLASDRKLPRGPISMRMSAIHHILTDHHLDKVESSHVADIARMIGDPVAILKSDSTKDGHYGWPLFITDVMVDGYGGKQPLVIPIRPDRDGSCPMVHTMYPWDPRRQDNRTIADAMHSDLLLAINPNKKEAAEYVGSYLPAGVSDLASRENVLDLSRYVNTDGTRGTERGYASIESLDADEVKVALENHEYPSDEDLTRFAGQEWADREIQFRRIIHQDPALMQTFKEAYDALRLEMETDAVPDENARLLEILDGMVEPEDRFDIGQESGDPARFIERMKWQLSFVGASDADKRFVSGLKDDARVIEVARLLAEGVDIAENTDVSPYLFRLVAQGDKPSTYAVRMARKELRDDARKYRRMLLEKDGNTQQLSYEVATEDTLLDTGEDAIQVENSEVRKLLSSDLDPVVKSLIRKNLANAETLQALAQAMDEQGRSLAAQLDERDLSIEHLMRMVEEGEAEHKERNKGYRDLQKRNNDNYERMRRYRRLLDTMIKRRDALATQVALERTVRRINRIAHPSPNADVLVMEHLGKFLRVMKADVGAAVDLTDVLKQAALDLEALPEQLRPFFKTTDKGVFFTTKLSKMSIGQLEFLKGQMASVRSDAKALYEKRSEERKQRITPTATAFLANAHGIETDNYTEYRQGVKELKSQAPPKGTHDSVKKSQDKRVKAFIDTMFLTPSRLIRQIDPSGNLSKWFFGVDGLDKIIAQEHRMMQERYGKASRKMRELGLDENILTRKHISIRGIDYTTDEAIGVYVYSHQKAAMDKLISVDGNRMTEDDISQITGSLSDSQKLWGDFLIEEMTSRHPALADVYHKVSNKSLGMVTKYFPLIRGDRDATMVDLLEDEHFTHQKAPQQQMLKERTGGNYSLALNATAIWNKMVRKQEHYIAAAGFVNDTQFLLRKTGGDLYDSISLSARSKYAEALQDFVDRFANRQTIQDNADTLLNAIRNNLIVARLSFNFMTALKQIPSLSYFTREFGPVRLLESLGQVLFNNRQTTEFIYSMAPQLKNRNLSTEFSSIADMEGRNAYQKAVKKVGNAGMYPIKLMDTLVVNTLWLGAYNSKISKGMDSQQAAVEASRFIGDTQPGGSVVDSAAIYASSSTMVKFLTMFTNQLNKNFNLLYSDIPYALKHHMYKDALANMVGLGLGFAGIILISGGFNQEDDDEEEYINQVFKQFGAQMLTQVPIFGKDLSNIMLDLFYSDNSMILISETNNLIKSIESKDSKRISDRINKLGLGIMEVLGYPSDISESIQKVLFATLR